MVELVRLGPSDVPALESYLRRRVEQSMFLLSNLQGHGIVDRGARLQGTYVAAKAGDEIVGVACHYHLGNLVVSAADHAADLGIRAARLSGRPVVGVVGPEDQVDAVAEALGLGQTRATVQLDERETLFRLELGALVEPSALSDGTVRGRSFAREDLPTMVEWTVQYRVEVLGDSDDEEMRRLVEEDLAEEIVDRHWVLEKDGELVAKTAFNARLPDVVQVGGVWTPPRHRGRGYARCVVASHLVSARAQGVELAILFTGDDNIPARRAYAALGFRPFGRYRVLLVRPR